MQSVKRYVYILVGGGAILLLTGASAIRLPRHAARSHAMSSLGSAPCA